MDEDCEELREECNPATCCSPRNFTKLLAILTLISAIITVYMRLRTAEGNVEAGPLLVEIAIFTIVILASVFALLAMIDDYPPYVFPFYVTLLFSSITITFYILLAICNLFATLTPLNNEQSPLRVLVSLIVILPINIYCTIIVKNCYVQFKAKQRRRKREEDGNSQLTQCP
ncbi:hypothetical protein QR680_010278 [Steinernema hermaphroditum]|uniref:Uncharacterized protein n=1 Tax=Steinernema hermaphroditum TaxID=289476 RepID=A0AA39IPM6_9BILA|nr:hypothetical protein QR680_010278 [Steinernema hermaphroditum]